MDMESRQAFDCVAALRDSRCDFFNAVVHDAEMFKQAKGHELSREERSQLRLESVEQMAEFLFLMEIFELNADATKLRVFLENHNRKIVDKLDRMAAEKQGYSDSGLPAARLRKGILDKAQIQTMVDEAEYMGLRYDQSSLGALLIEVMSLASSRNLIILLSDCGFLKRIGAGTKTIRSTGKLEVLYRRKVARVIQGVVGSSAKRVA